MINSSEADEREGHLISDQLYRQYSDFWHTIDEISVIQIQNNSAPFLGADIFYLILVILTTDIKVKMKHLSL